MKRYFKGILFLGVMIIFLLFVLLFGKKALDNTQSVLLEMRERGENNTVRYEKMKEDLLVNSQTIEALSEFSQSWKQCLVNGTDPNKVLNDIVGLSFKHTVAVSEKSAQRSKVTEKGVVKETISLTLKVVGKFERIYAWLGAVEEAYPYAKINQLELMAENMNAALTLGLQLPIII